MYANRIACCSLVSHVEYAPRAVLRLEKDRTGRQTDGRVHAKPLQYAFHKTLDKNLDFVGSGVC